ncbi:hypothetical protein D3C86_1674110 [compost metagenome]
MDLGTTAITQGLNDCPACAAGTQNHGPLGLVPARMTFIEIGDETVTIRIGGAKTALLHPDSVGGAEFFRQSIGFICQPIGRFLMGNSDIAADGCARLAFLQHCNEIREIIRRDFNGLIRTGNPEFLQPVRMDNRRPRMLDRVTDNEGIYG